MRISILVILMLGLVACGGGGSSEGGAPSGYAITSVNHQYGGYSGTAGESNWQASTTGTECFHIDMPSGSNDIDLCGDDLSQNFELGDNDADCKVLYIFNSMRVVCGQSAHQNLEAELVAAFNDSSLTSFTPYANGYCEVRQVTGTNLYDYSDCGYAGNSQDSRYCQIDGDKETCFRLGTAYVESCPSCMAAEVYYSASVNGQSQLEVDKLSSENDPIVASSSAVTRYWVTKDGVTSSDPNAVASISPFGFDVDFSGSLDLSLTTVTSDHWDAPVWPYTFNYSGSTITANKPDGSELTINSVDLDGFCRNSNYDYTTRNPSIYDPQRGHLIFVCHYDDEGVRNYLGDEKNYFHIMVIDESGSAVWQMPDTYRGAFTYTYHNQKLYVSANRYHSPIISVYDDYTQSSYPSSNLNASRLPGYGVNIDTGAGRGIYNSIGFYSDGGVIAPFRSANVTSNGAITSSEGAVAAFDGNGDVVFEASREALSSAVQAYFGSDATLAGASYGGTPLKVADDGSTTEISVQLNGEHKSLAIPANQLGAFQAYVESFEPSASGETSLYCDSGADLCVEYQFSNAADRALALADCAIPVSQTQCTSGAVDFCNVSNGFVQNTMPGATGTVNYTFHTFAPGFTVQSTQEACNKVK